MEPTVHLRPATLDEVPAMGVLARARELALDGTAETTDAEIAHDLGGPDVDLARDTRIVEDAEGRVIGYGDVMAEDAGRLTITVWTPPEEPCPDLSPHGAASGHRGLGGDGARRHRAAADRS